jgi:uncharacterized delta-60 repeat protein
MKVVSIKHSGTRLMVVFLCLLGIINVFGVGGVDTAFSAAVYTSSGEITDAAVQADGKIVFAGNFTVVNNAVRTRVARFNTDGTVDAAFNPPELSGNSLPTMVAIQPDGKIIVGGDFFVVNSTRKYIIRLNPDGSLDNSFADLSGEHWQGFQIMSKIIIRPDGKILFSGQSVTVSGRGGNMHQLNTDGSFDASFFFGEGSGIYDSTLMPDGKIIANAELSTSRYNSDGSRDTSFPTLIGSGGSSSVKIGESEVLPDGKLLIGGDFTSVNGVAARYIARILPDGSVDMTFNTGGAGANARLYDVSTTSDGKIYISGEFSQYNGVARSRVARLNADGSLDTSFNYTLPTSGSYVKKTIGLSDGKVLIMGSDVGGTGVSLVRLNADGSPDTAIRAVAGAGGSVRDIVRQPDGKYIVGGAFDIVNGVSRRRIARLNADGSVDPTFECPLFANLFATVTKLAVQTDGKILLTLLDFPGSIRLNTDGTHDSTYVPPPIVNGHDIDIFPNGQILVDGYYKLNPDGSNDTSFSPPNQAATSVLVLSAVIQPDGKIVVGGVFGQIGTSHGNIARLNPNGSVDATFNPSSGANNRVADLDVQTDGKVVIAGDFTSVNANNTRKYLARLNPDGSLDTSFAPVINAPLSSVKIQPDGKILISGTLSTVNGIPRKGYARLNSDGSLDMSFNIGGGANSTVWRIGLQPDNKVLIAGDFTKVDGFATIGVARLNAMSVKTPFDYDGDGKADVSVFRGSENQWYVLQSSNFQVVQKIFASPNDIPAPADYDGDGKTDFAIYRPSSGDFWYLSSINNAQINVHWGASGDIPRPADFDGDGKADFIVYRPSNSVWYRFGSTGAISILAFGIAEDKPLIGDFDGDGKADQAIFRPSTGDWWYASSVSGQFLATHWGATGDIPVPADYDGDGKTDFAIFRPSNGGWFISNSSNGSFTTTSFGLSTDKPVAADFDGDGKADIAVYRPTDHTWYLLQTTAGFGALQFGNATDLPTENAFLP